MRGHLKPMVFKIIKQEPVSGAQIVEKIREATGWKPSYGSIYPLLKASEKQSELKSEKSGKQKLYSLTKKGEKELKDFESKKEKLLDDLIQRFKLMEELFDMQTKADILFLQKVKEGKAPFIEFHRELNQVKKEHERILQKKLYKTKKDELKKIIQKHIKDLKKIR